MKKESLLILLVIILSHRFDGGCTDQNVPPDHNQQVRL